MYTLNASELSDLANFGTVSFREDEIYSLGFGDDRLDSIRLETGTLTLSVNSDGSIPLSGEMSILDPFTGESVFSVGFSDDSPPISASINEDFTDLLFRLRSDDEYDNGIRLAFSFELTDNGGTYPDEISFALSLNDFSIASAGGYIAPRIIQLDDQEARISIFDDEFEGVLRLEDPRSTFSFFFFFFFFFFLTDMELVFAL